MRHAANVYFQALPIAMRDAHMKAWAECEAAIKSRYHKGSKVFEVHHGIEHARCLYFDAMLDGNTPAAGITQAITDARADRIGKDALDDFLAKRFGKRLVPTLHAVHKREEDRPIETRWDAMNAVTAYARDLPHQDTRVDLERKAGALLG